jgi:hypothetical protein
MDDVKRRVLELISAERVRVRGHFMREAAKERVIVDDVLRAIRRGSRSSQADADSKFGVRHVFRGTDTLEKKWDVVVSVDESTNTLWLHTVFPTQSRKLRR